MGGGGGGGGDRGKHQNRHFKSVSLHKCRKTSLHVFLTHMAYQMQTLKHFFLNILFHFQYSQ